MNLGWSIVYNSSAHEGVIGRTFQRILISLYIGFVLANTVDLAKCPFCGVSAGSSRFAKLPVYVNQVCIGSKVHTLIFCNQFYRFRVFVSEIACQHGK